MPKPEGWVGSDLRARYEVAQWLHDHGDEVHDPTGLMVGRMRTELNKGRALSQLLADMDNDGMIEREVRGRRTFMIKLVDDWGLLADHSLRSPAYREPARTAPAKDGDGVEISGDIDLQALAETLLALVIKRAQPTAQRSATTEKQAEEIAKLKHDRQELRDALLIARESEKEAIRNADKMRESLAKAQSQVAAAVDKQQREAAKKRGSSVGSRLRPQDQALLRQLQKTLK